MVTSQTPSLARLAAAAVRRAENRDFAWGFLDQAFSSATNFGLTLLAARLVGPGGVGVVFIGFSSYLLALHLQQALLTEPLVAASASLPAAERARVVRFGLTLSVLWALAATGALVAAGAALPTLGRSLLLFAPWLLPALVQDFLRGVLFRDRRARNATETDGAWLVAMALVASVAWTAASDVTIVAAWGAGALAAMLLALAQVRARPAPLRESLRWWHAEAWPFGRWLGAENVVYAAVAYVQVFTLAAIIGTHDLGGLQAMIALFAPLTLIGPAIALPGLPALGRAAAVSTASAQTLAGRLAAASTAVVAVYFGLMAATRHWLVPLVYGGSFSTFLALLWPIGAGQLVRAAGGAYTLLLKAERRGRTTLVASGVGLLVSLGLTVGLASVFGTAGAAWGIGVGGAVTTALTIALALRPLRGGRTSRRAPVTAPLAQPRRR